MIQWSTPHRRHGGEPPFGHLVWPLQQSRATVAQAAASHPSPPAPHFPLHEWKIQPMIPRSPALATLHAGGTRNILREHRPPPNDAGNEFCVAWWTRRGCFPNCGRRLTHVPFASPSERERLLTYVHTHLQAPAAAGTGGGRVPDGVARVACLVPPGCWRPPPGGPIGPSTSLGRQQGPHQLRRGFRRRSFNLNYRRPRLNWVSWQGPLVVSFLHKVGDGL